MHLIKRILLGSVLCLWATVNSAHPYADEIYSLFERAAKKEIQLHHFETYSPVGSSNTFEVIAYTYRSIPSIVVFNDNKATRTMEASSFLQTFSSVTSFESIGEKDLLLAFILNHGVHGQRFILIDPTSGEKILEETSDWGIKLDSDDEKLWFIVVKDEQEHKIKWPSN